MNAQINITHALLEHCAELVHEAWIETKTAQGTTSRLSEWGEEQMVPYQDLSERAKDLDRATVRAVFGSLSLTFGGVS